MSVSTQNPPIEGFRRSNENLIRLTPAAGGKVRDLIDRDGEGAYLRVRISGGGCNGLSYGLSFENAPKRGDILVESENAQVIVDSKSALYLKGSVLDYSSEMVMGGFKFSNPNARSSCSCGESFSL